MSIPTRKTSKHSLRHSKAAGLTLIEVVVSIGLLGALLAGTLSIRNRHIRQINRAFDKQQAVELLDNQLAFWFSQNEGFPIGRSGNFARSEDYYWEVTEIPAVISNPQWKARTVRVEVFSTASNEPVTSVELVDSLEDRN